jgi:hypothetical protein
MYGYDRCNHSRGTIEEQYEVSALDNSVLRMRRPVLYAALHWLHPTFNVMLFY